MRPGTGSARTHARSAPMGSHHYAVRSVTARIRATGQRFDVDVDELAVDQLVETCGKALDGR